MSEDVRLETAAEVATLTITREARRNALDHHSVAALRTALSDLVASDIKVIVLTGEGQKSFCAGDDIKAYKDRTPAESRAHFERGLKLMDEIATHPALVIAAIEGYCFGGGLELATACDHRIASEEARFALPEVRKLRANPSWGGLTRLPKLIGLAAARRLALMGQEWTAREALSHGLVDDVVPAGKAVAKSQEVANAFSDDVDREVVARAKRVLNEAAGPSESANMLFNFLIEAAQPFEG